MGSVRPRAPDPPLSPDPPRKFPAVPDRLRLRNCDCGGIGANGIRGAAGSAPEPEGTGRPRDERAERAEKPMEGQVKHFASLIALDYLAGQAG